MSAPAVAVSADGTKWVAAWMDTRSGKADRDVFWATGAGAKVGNDERVHDDGRRTQDHPALSIDGQGAVWIAWVDARSGKQQVWARSSKASGNGSAVSLNGLDHASYPSVAAGGGVVALVYECGKGRRDHVAVRLLVP